MFCNRMIWLLECNFFPCLVLYDILFLFSLVSLPYNFYLKIVLWDAVVIYEEVALLFFAISPYIDLYSPLYLFCLGDRIFCWGSCR